MQQAGDDRAPRTVPEVNRQVAEKLREMADLISQQGGNPFRVGAYRRAARSLESLTEDLRERVAEGGPRALESLPGIGRGIATAIDEILRTGRWSQLERLRGSLDPERLFQTVPGIGPELARRIHDRLHIDTLEALELAAHDGRLEQVEGIGPRRAAVIRGLLAEMLGRVRGSRPRQAAAGPDVGLLLAVDREYREKAGAGLLPRIAPRRFNPAGEAWLPILHTERGGWHFTAMYSNTARAHELGRTRDWVVIFHYDDHQQEGQHTVVTEIRGPLAGRRVVRGREAECLAWYAEHEGRHEEEAPGRQEK